MKNKTKLLLGVLLCLALNTAAKFSQVIYISPTSAGIINAGGFYTFDNDDIQIRYSFWAENGIMAFIIYNKTDKPIYIDWKKSAMIYNGKQNPYYTNKTTSNYMSYGTSYGYSWADIFGITRVGSGTVNATETIIKPERITFIPPRSYIAHAFYNLLGYITAFSLDKQESEQAEVNKATVYVNTPKDQIIFRNFITYSTTEDFATERYADNEFCIKKILTMHNYDFNHNNEGWEKPTRIYISDIKRKYVFE